MAKSMTGYGISTFELDSTSISVEIRAVNHRFLDIVPKYPRTFLFLEDKIKRIIKSYFNRGRIEIHVDLDGNSFVDKSIVADWELMDQFVHELQKAKERYSLSGDIQISMITELPDLITVHANEDKPSELQELLLTYVERACQQVLEMRLEEGKYLIEDIIRRASAIRDMVLLLEGRREAVIEEYRNRIKKRIADFVDKQINLDEGRIHQEIAMLAEKGDISEEITRLLSHLDQMQEICNSDEPIGRKLDFIVQEMNREANTIGSKSSDSMIGEWTVELKSEIEKIKEQVQNIE
ncbi:YicC/YloC family endoribonuclease [Ornithinibacillus californiensis]|uniref:YicC/YloC family endoribonuclease n=1 Tax=Ornithinibacillus californiensis TaxID=161536 RepID=UPI00069F5D05|nr:YicC/YloC family endoribonuclease [Ornithinibacillus californiensis]